MVVDVLPHRILLLNKGRNAGWQRGNDVRSLGDKHEVLWGPSGTLRAIFVSSEEEGMKMIETVDEVRTRRGYLRMPV